MSNLCKVITSQCVRLWSAVGSACLAASATMKPGAAWVLRGMVENAGRCAARTFSIFSLPDLVTPVLAMLARFVAL